MDSMRNYQFEVEYDGSAVERAADVAAFWRAKVAGIGFKSRASLGQARTRRAHAPGWRSRDRQHRQSGQRCAALG
jgi:hypothetical protein